MIGHLDKSPQLEIFRIPLRNQIPEDHELVRLSRNINWDKMTEALSIHYSPDKGRRAIPVRKMAAMVLLKHLYGGTDEGILLKWLEDPAFQYFSGEVYRKQEMPFSRSELVKFRHRIGRQGMEVIFSIEVLLLIDDLMNRRENPVEPAHAQWQLVRFFRQLFSGKGPVPN